MSAPVLAAGIAGRCSEIVVKEKTAEQVGSGDTAVYATPAMIALVEKTAVSVLEGCLEDGKTTVGTMINAKHLAATPVGMKVECECVLTELDGRRLAFEFKVHDECGLVAEGTHERFIVSKESFSKRAEEKLKK